MVCILILNGILVILCKPISVPRDMPITIGYWKDNMEFILASHLNVNASMSDTVKVAMYYAILVGNYQEDSCIHVGHVIATMFLILILMIWNALRTYVYQGTCTTVFGNPCILRLTWGSHLGLVFLQINHVAEPVRLLSHHYYIRNFSNYLLAIKMMTASYACRTLVSVTRH